MSACFFVDLGSMSTDSAQNYIVTARKWRPETFADIVGQEHVSRTLVNALSAHRVHHAYMFNGPRGVGKTTTARVLARAVNCLNRNESGEPCNACAVCTDILEGRSLDIIEIDGASNNSVEDVRQLRENAKYPPSNAKYKMYIIDEVHMLSTSAFNALLKTLEEPPPHLMFVFATTEPHKVPATIMSRCQRFDFRRMQSDEVVQHLGAIATADGIEIDEATLRVIARKGDGSMRDSQSIFDQVVAFCGKSIAFEEAARALNLIDFEFFFDVATKIYEGDSAALFDTVKQIYQRGYDLQEFVVGLQEHYRNVLTVIVMQNTELIDLSAEYRERYAEVATAYTEEDVLQILNALVKLERELKFASDPRMRLEFSLISLAKMPSAVDLGALIAAVKNNAPLPEQPEKKTLKSPAPKPVQPTAPPVSRQAPAQAAPVVEEPKVTEPARTASPATPAPNKTLDQSWHALLTQNKQIDPVCKSYLRNQALVETSFGIGTVRLQPVNDVIGATLRDATAMLQRELSLLAGETISVTVDGAAGGVDEFDDQPQVVVAPSTEPLHPLDEAIVREFKATTTKRR